jgi:meiosis-specific protein
MADIATSSVDPSGPSVVGSYFKMPAATPARSAQVLEQPIELIQSLDLVQTTVCATISTVAFLRGLFPDDCFRTHQYDIEDSNYSYKAFMDATGDDSPMAVSKPKKVDHRFIPWQILVRGRNKGASKLLDWIVSAITEYFDLG